ncbi:hypothetical protein B0F90DRAFT_224479 [Multifurca ochricompacta]|uniref:Uncharacterized protein n=1 Tax=Multifurca ochricompacta TaxID=376703 RepID=A0AAD4LW60_9AGAM|nr:hypothetical protein B0F90DRAFT_224479 [Multifurca ochricompacta]
MNDVKGSKKGRRSWHSVAWHGVAGVVWRGVDASNFWRCFLNYSPPSFSRFNLLFTCCSRDPLAVIRTQKKAEAGGQAATGCLFLFNYPPGVRFRSLMTQTTASTDHEEYATMFNDLRFRSVEGGVVEWKFRQIPVSITRGGSLVTFRRLAPIPQQLPSQLRTKRMRAGEGGEIVIM